MKKAKIIGKKTLSVFLAVLMVLTAWVWVAPTEAEAATAGNYKVKVWLDIDDAAYSGDQTIYIDYYTNNGNGSTGTDSSFNFSSFNDGDVTAEVDNIPGFPYQVRVYSNGLNLWTSTLKYGINVSVTAAGGSSYTDVYTESTSTHSHSGTSAFTDTVTIPKSKFPYVNTFPTITVNRDIYLPSIITSGRYSSNTVTVGQAKDQYGVNYMDAETITVSGSVCGSTGLTTSKSGSVLTVTGANTAKNENGTSQTATVVAKWKSANTSYDAESEYRSKTYSNAFTIYNPEHKFTYDGNGGTVTTSSAVKYYKDTIGSSYPTSGVRTGFTFLGMYYGKHADSYETLIPNSTKLTATTKVTENHTWYAAWQANQYKMKFTYRDENGNWVTTDEVTEYFGRDIPFPDVTSPVDEGVDHTYTFTGWSPAHTTVQAVDGVTEYTAVYDDEPHYAVLTELEKQINASKEKKAEQLYLEGAYTDSTVAVFENMFNTAEDLAARKPLLSEQDTVDSIAATLKTARENLDIKNYTVIFVDEDGTILKDGYFFVPYGATVTVPTNPEKAADETNHYTFGGWDTEESDSLDACNYVTANLIYVASFAAEAHTFTETVTPSTCTEDGVITKTCTCGFSYTVAGETAGHKWSTDYKELVPATCATKGTEAKCCTACGAIDESSKREIAVLGHTWGEYTEYTPATCVGEGSKVAVCSRCGGKDVEKIPQKSHSYGSAEVIKKTCTTDGYTKETCTVCGFTNIRDIDKATGHSISTTTVDSTCVSSGYTKEDCANCDYEKTTILPATGVHTFIDNWTTVSEASCVGHGVEKRVCTVCKAATETRLTAFAAHTEPADWTTEKEAWCGLEGRKVKDCTVCGKELAAEAIPALSHNYEAYAEGSYAETCTSAGATAEKCSRCGDIKTTVIQPLGHDWKDILESTVDATCENDGSKTYKCQNCNETNVVVIPKLGHNWNDWVKIDATNTTDGSWSRVCSKCNKTESLVIPKGHNLVVDTENSKAATCESAGKTVYKCENHTDCGVTIEVTHEKLNNSITSTRYEATCANNGYIERKCSLCQKVISKETLYATAHVFDNGTTFGATCTQAGYVEFKCTKNCNYSFKSFSATDVAKGHNFNGTETVISAATCTTDGEKTVKCTRCDVKTTVVIPKTGHNYVEDTTKATEATCTALATKTYKCSCGASYVKHEGTLAAHKFDTLVKTVPATNESLGYEERKCVCGLTEITILEATGTHVFEEKIESECVAPTCTENGTDVYKCKAHTDCGVKSTVLVPRLGHSVIAVYNAPTCTAEGSSEAYCVTCTETVATTKIPAIGHLYGEGKVTPATCKETGKIEYTCTRTDCTDKNKTVVIPVNEKAHQYATVVTHATCYAEGSVITKCSVCDKEITNEKLAKIEHTWNAGVENPKATCTTGGTMTYTCKVDKCGATKTEDVDALGHNWDEWVKVDATNDKDGSWTRTCKNDANHTETVIIPKGNHQWDDGTVTKEASCTETGTKVYKCKTHTGDAACGVTITVTLDKLQHELETTKTDAKCEANGEVVTKCKHCDTTTIVTIIPATGHTYDDGVKTNATCTQTGKIVYTCTAKDCGKIKEVILDMLQHEYKAGTSVAPTCTSSGYTPYKCKTCDSSYVILGEAAKGHNYEKVVSSTATCGKAGKITLECTECADTMTADVDAIGHNYVKISSTEATCAAAATETYKCNNCDAEYTVSVGSKTEDHDFGEWVTVEKASYDSIGYKTRTCKVCSKLEVETIPATGSHNLVEFKRDNATCTAEGKIYYACNSHADCGVTDEVVIPKLGHEEALSYKAASCTEAGYTKIVCSRCGELENKTIDKLDHSFEITEIKNSTCAQTGTISLKCKNCTETKIVDIPVNADAHKFTSTTVAATCKSEGSITVICENGCGYKKITPLDKLQHKWNSWSVTTPSTNGAEGEMTRTCDNGCIETVKIPAGGHAFGKEPDSIIPASCTAEGTATYKCTEHTNCGVEITVKLDKVQHSLVTDIKEATCTEEGHVRVYCTKCEYDKAVNMTIGKLAHSDKVIETKPATCTTAAYTTYECENCHRAFSKLDAQPSGHRYLNEGAVVVTNATCETAGYTTYNCDNCDETHTVNLVAAKGHSWTEWTVEKAATNAEKGILSRTCINGCGKKETAEIPAGGHSFNTDEPSATTDGTCLVKGTKTFKCSVHSDCGVTITVETEFGAHNWSEWTKVDATNDKDGSWKRECTVCHETETHVIPKGNHTFGDKPSSTVPATCKKTGTATYNCTTHTNCGVTITVVLYMIQHTPKVDKKDASCTAIGYVKTYCEKCNDVISYVELPATGHINTSVVREESTCIKKGTEKVICACGHIVSVKELPFAEHNYEMTYENGVYTYTCKVEGCKHSYTETVETTFTVKFFAADKKTVLKTEAVKSGEAATAPAAPSKGADDNYHYTFSEWDRDFSEITSDLDVYPTYEKEAHYGGAATCTEKAVCDECGTGYGETDASKHVIDTKVTPATCEKDGVLEYYCTENGCTYSKTEVIKKTGHSLGAWETYQNGNCATPTIKIRKCRNNGCKYYEQKESYGSHTWYIQPEVAPTCTTVGYSEYKYCTTCGMEIDSVVIPKLNHRDNDGDGNCDYCTYTEPVLKCSCMCHSSGFMKFIYSIVRFFWIITKSQPACNCGAKHY